MTTKSQGQPPSRPRQKGQTTCLHHQSKELTLFCVTCGELVCAKCVTSVHQSHTIEELGNIVPGKREELQAYIDTTGNIQLLQLKKDIAAAEEELKRNASRFKDLAAQAKEQGERLKTEIDILVTTSVAQCKQIEDKNAKLITTYKKELQTRHDVLNKQLQDQKKLMQKASDIQIYDAEVDTFANSPLPPSPDLHVSNFMPNKSPRNFLEQALGTLETIDTKEKEPEIQPQQKPQRKQTKAKHPLGRLSKSQPSVYRLPSVSEHGRSSGMSFIKKPLKLQHEESIEMNPPPRYQLKQEPTVLSEFTSPCKVSAICCTPGGDAWVCFEDTKTITLMGQSGDVRKQIQYQVRLCDVKISPITHNLWACSNADKSIIEWQASGLPVIKFQTELAPRCMCLSQHSGFVVLGMSKEVAIFTSTGRMISSSRTVMSGSGVSSPKRISECPVTGNLAIVDQDRIADGGQNKRHIVIADNKLRKLNHFRGEISADVVVQRPFNPSDVIYDAKGNIVVGDCTNKSITLLSGSAEFIGILDLGTCYTVAVGLHADTVWGVYRMNSTYDVKILQYATTHDEEEGNEKEEDTSNPI
ncbi:uncharacterized protein LOC110453243 [Mizuhopecten yessoensis]|uniref:uncharacterized protein LOC110453243 n=1 Tax=Mizuhopecten yessoensis TaxID=6573 RepID=UPI000B45C3D8|nr:uncharacterized protein LOC110453243 [Mizuhopecten yessoensis]